MSTTDHRRQSWPYTSYNGAAEGWSNHLVEREAYYIDKGKDHMISSPSPRDIPRVEVAYTVETDNDPNGALGTTVDIESVGDYEKRCQDDVDFLKKYWAKTIPGYNGEARQCALKAHALKPYDLRFMLQMINAEFGTKTDKATTRLVREFVSNTKSPAEDITAFCRKFSQAAETLSGSDMPLPEPFLVNLFLISLGFPYRAVETTAAALPRDKRTLAKVMSLARDHTVHSGDEVDMKDKALLAIIRNMPKRKFEAAFAVNNQKQQEESSTGRCGNCNGMWHTKDTCFNTGGGLAHLNSKQRREYLQEKREARYARNSNRTYNRERDDNKNDKQDDQAKVALEAKMTAMQTAMEAAAQQVEDYGIQVDLGFDKFK